MTKRKDPNDYSPNYHKPPKKISKLRVGDIYESNTCGTFTVVNYRDCDNVTIQFTDTGHIMVVQSSRVFRGNVKDPFARTVYGIGYLGVGNHRATIDGKATRTYMLWANMLNRCYNEDFLEDNPSYEDCSVVSRWHNFQNFSEDIKDLPNYEIWLDKDTGYQLDKDVRVTNNRIYGPATCQFIHASHNGYNGAFRRKHIGGFCSHKH